MKTTTFHIPESKKVFFLSDFHLGIPNHETSLEREKKLIAFLENIRAEAHTIFLMGDIFDFWFEYKTVIPKGFTRFFGKIAELTDAGIDIHLFCGNHDIWAFNYFEKELNIKMHRHPELFKLNNKLFYLAHGDGLGAGDKGYKILKKIFDCKLNQWLFNWIHPDFGMKLGLHLSRRSRYSNTEKEQKRTEIIEMKDLPLLEYSKQILNQNIEIQYFIYGHWHYKLSHQITDNCQIITLGDWIKNFSYAVFDGENLQQKTYQ